MRDTQERQTPLGHAAGGKTRLPPWIRVRLPARGASVATADLLAAAHLHTVCQSAHCPNEPECFGRGTATFMILGAVCTRHCSFCAVRTGEPVEVDADEPRRVAETAAQLKLKHVVITSVTRDDLPDGGSGAFAATIGALRARLPAATIEVLIPDFLGHGDDLARVLNAKPDVLNHNLETVRRLQEAIRPAADYGRSLGVLRGAAGWSPRPVVKSGLMVGVGEADEELYTSMADLVAAGCDLLTIGQYLAPSPQHAPVTRFVTREQFGEYGRRGRAMGFRGVAAGPLVRSSYQAQALLVECRTG
jgi:lipoyl synthase